MLADIGLIGAIYMFLRLLLSLVERRGTLGPRYHPAIVAVTVLGMLVLFVLALDIMLISSGLGAETGGF